MASKAPARIVVPGIAQKLKRANSEGSPLKTIEPATNVRMAKNVLNVWKESTAGTTVTPQVRDCVVAETVTGSAHRFAIGNRQSKI